MTDLITAVGNEASRWSGLKSDSHPRAFDTMGGWDVCLALSYWCPHYHDATPHDNPEGIDYCLYLVAALDVSREDTTSRAPKGGFWH